MRSEPRLPLEEHLRAYVRAAAGDRPNTKTQRDKVTRLSNRAVEAVTAAMDHAWALRRLAERYATEDLSELEPRPRSLLEVMVRDHAAGIDAETARLREQVEPALLFIADRGAIDTTAAGVEEARLDVTDPAGDWTSAAVTVFQRVHRMQKLVLALFVGSEAPSLVEKADSGETRLHILSTEQAVARLLAGSQRLPGDLTALGQATAPAFRAERESGAAPEPGRLPKSKQ